MVSNKKLQLNAKKNRMKKILFLPTSFYRTTIKQSTKIASAATDNAKGGLTHPVSSLHCNFPLLTLVGFNQG